jgi:hypothetical protein
MYDFKTQLAVGEKSEEQLDELFSQWYTCHPVDMDMQRKGIDRIFTKEDGTRITVQYKIDYKTQKTGNAFIETVSVDVKNIPGWAYTCEADYIVYRVPGYSPTDVHIIPTKALQEALPKWEQTYKTRGAKNRGYMTYGLLVPFPALAKLATKKYSI